MTDAREVNRARIRLSILAGRAADLFDPVAVADKETSLADARAAFCIARGVPLEYIDPAVGLDCSPDAYRRVRQIWESHLAAWPEDTKTVAAARAGWMRRRPDVVALVEGDPGEQLELEIGGAR